MPKFKYIIMTLGTLVAMGAGCASTTTTTEVQNTNTTTTDVVDTTTDTVEANTNATPDDTVTNTNTVNATVDTTETTTTDTDTTTTETTDTTVTETAEPTTQTFDITASQFAFDPSTITVKKGDTVVLNITSEDVPHGFSLPEFDVNETLSPGSTKTVEFVADQAGSFSFTCSVVCGSGHSTMSGKLVVEE